ncbi:monooxygenase 3 isoform X2 [Medicago truncatula]|uniref:monooxygenase 3 isoform X2 n=1 Tax=Medicago truncatula TaxID=3880 RepID=UPI00196737CC|nr:monooxygenase 3 isoform X2 [Medicago truncatula]
METVIEEDIVIVGAGIAGLTTSLGLYRHVTTSLITGQQISTTSFMDNKGKHGGAYEVRRKLLLEALANELPSGTIRYMSKVVAIQESGLSKILHLADGTTIKTKVLIGCDGVNSVVAKWLGFKEASYVESYVTRGYVELKDTHELEPMFKEYLGKGFRVGAVPCDDKCAYWFFTCTPSKQDKELAEDPAKLKQYVLSKLEEIPSYVRFIIENTNLDALHSAPLRYRHPWELIMGNISKNNVCVAGDALHPMAPYLAQGGCCALEDGVVLARCLGEVFSKKPKEEEEEEEYKRIEEGLKKYAKERRWRWVDLITTSYIVGSIHESGSKFVNFFKGRLLAAFFAALPLKKSNFDCGQLK